MQTEPASYFCSAKTQDCAPFEKSEINIELFRDSLASGFCARKRFENNRWLPESAIAFAVCSPKDDYYFTQ